MSMVNMQNCTEKLVQAIVHLSKSSIKVLREIHKQIWKQKEMSFLGWETYYFLNCPTAPSSAKKQKEGVRR